MKYYKIKTGNAITHLYTFIDYDCQTDSKSLADTILNEIPYFQDVGYAGFRKKSALKKHVQWGILNKNTLKQNSLSFEQTVKIEIEKTIENVIVRCQKTVSSSTPVRVFIFPTFNSFVKKNMSGISGFCHWKNAIIIFIHPTTKGWKTALRNSICHEYAHAFMLNYYKMETLLDGIIFNGLAEHFRKAVVGGVQESWSKSLDKKEAKDIFQELKSKLGSKSRKLYNEVFYGGGRKYPLWSGYSIGYHIVKSYMSNLEKTNWSEILRKTPKEILKKSYFDI